MPKRLNRNTVPCLAALVLLCGAAPSAAQETTAQPSPPPAPWGARCASEGRSTTPDCVVEQRVVISGTGQLLTAVTIRIPPETQQPVMVIQTPFGLYLPAGLKLAVDEAPIGTLPLRTCDAGGCYATDNVSADLLATLKRGINLTVTFQDAAQRDIAVPVSLNGFTAAYEKIQ